jgi:hypothetical protein
LEGVRELALQLGCFCAIRETLTQKLQPGAEEGAGSTPDTPVVGLRGPNAQAVVQDVGAGEASGFRDSQQVRKCDKHAAVEESVIWRDAGVGW